MTAIVLSLLLASTGGQAYAIAPNSLTFSGRLADADGPIDGAASATFAIFDAETGGTSLWEETYQITADEGQLSVVLGDEMNPIDSGILDGTARYLEIIVNGETLTPRLLLNSVPYAIRANTAAVATDADALGGLAPSAYQSRISGTCPSGQAIRAVSATGSVTCEGAPALSCTQRTANGTAAPSGNGSVTASCLPAEVLVGGGCDATGGPGTSSRQNYDNYPSSTASWTCGYHNSNSGLTLTFRAYANCCILN